jgi:anti-sigma regulatory factor (Ser/Thr protein kinase)
VLRRPRHARAETAPVISRELAGPDEVQVDFDADPTAMRQVRQMLRGWLADHSIVDPQQSNLLVAVNEAITNSIEHAYKGENGPVRLTWRASTEHVELVIVDQGIWQGTHDPMLGAGRGLAVMHAFVDDVAFNLGPDGTTVRLLANRPEGTRTPADALRD